MIRRRNEKVEVEGEEGKVGKKRQEKWYGKEEGSGIWEERMRRRGLRGDEKEERRRNREEGEERK